ncbi:oxygen-dependent coproporphyrinogen oxidase [Rhodohalobacter sp. 8-1]|uniref:oxygen-dependent coproporphyrinogen oxidase n=1 Tax=Rhodohalobacter sp. 8-1 TaxID=3131972 RepID=UPI00403F353F
MKQNFSNYIDDLQNKICTAMEETDGSGKFKEDDWDREGGGGGRTRVIEKGDVFEKGGVNVSRVWGELPDPIKKHFNVDSGWFWAGGVSLVLHPENPMVPTVHANFRYFELYDDESMDNAVDGWFGGGADLTPYYLFEEDAEHFHKTLKEACDRHHSSFYPEFKKECDEYFYNSHRGEARGIGGLFFDYRRATDEMSLDDWYAFTTDVGDAFIESYHPIAEKRKKLPFTPEQRYWQEIRRGRYVEFNLVHDRGTLFGLKTNGRIESILMSLPPEVRWDYDHHPEKGTKEAELVDVLKSPREWV